MGEPCYLHPGGGGAIPAADRKSTRLNSSHSQTSYAVFCLKKNSPDIRRQQSCPSTRKPMWPSVGCASSPSQIPYPAFVSAFRSVVLSEEYCASQPPDISS